MDTNIGKKVFAVVLAVMVGMVFSVTMLQADAHAASVSKVTGVKAIVNDNQVTISWKKASGAKKYQVYRATSKNGNYKRVKTTSSRKFIDKSSTGLHWYKVRSVRGSKVSSFSSKKAIYMASLQVNSHNGNLIRTQIYNSSSKHTMYMVGISMTYTFIVSDKATHTISYDKIPANLSDANGNVYVSYSAVPPKSTAYVFYKTMRSIPSKYWNTSVYDVVATPYFTLSGNTGSGLEFQLLGGSEYKYTGVVRIR